MPSEWGCFAVSNSKLVEHKASYVKFIDERLVKAKRVRANPMVTTGRYLDFSICVPDAFSPGNCPIFSEPVLDVIDYK